MKCKQKLKLSTEFEKIENYLELPYADMLKTSHLEGVRKQLLIAFDDGENFSATLQELLGILEVHQDKRAYHIA